MMFGMKFIAWLHRKLARIGASVKATEPDARGGGPQAADLTVEASELIADLEGRISTLRAQSPAERPDPSGSLGSVTDPALLVLLCQTMGDEDAYLRASAIHALRHYDLEDEAEVAQALLRAVSSDPDEIVRAAAAYVLPLIGVKAQDALSAALADPSTAVRGRAVCALGAFDDEIAVAAMCKCLRDDPDEDVRIYALRGLESIEIEHVVHDLIRALDDPSPAVRAAALWTLQNRRSSHENPISVEAFIQCLADPDAKVREAAAQACRYSMPIAIPALIGALGDSAPGVRTEALLALGSLEADEALEAVAALLYDDPEEEVRDAAVSALRDLHAPGATLHLVKALEDKSARVRHGAAMSLSWKTEAPNGAVVRALCKSLGDKDEEVRRWAASSLERQFAWNEPDWDIALEPLCAAARDPHTPVRVEAIEVLGLASDPRALAAITQALGDEDSAIKAKAIESLAQIDPLLCLEQSPRLLADPDIELQRAAIKALGRLHDVALPPEVLDFFSNDNNDLYTREQVAELLGANGNPAYVPALLKALSIDDDSFRSAVVKALGVAGDRRAVPALIDCLRDEYKCVRQEAALALAAIGDEQALKPLKKLILDEEPSVRRRVVWALSFFEPAKVQKLLVGRLQDEDEHVQSTAVAALAAICDARSLRRISSSLPRSLVEVKELLEEEAETQDCESDGEPSGEPRLVHRGTIHYE